jgi:hypothetical protein
MAAEIGFDATTQFPLRLRRCDQEEFDATQRYIGLPLRRCVRTSSSIGHCVAFASFSVDPSPH